MIPATITGQDRTAPAKQFVAVNEGLKILDTEYIIENYAIGISKDNPELYDAFGDCTQCGARVFAFDQDAADAAHPLAVDRDLLDSAKRTAPASAR